LQKSLLAYELFIKNEMPNHAAAGAYAFLLSGLPIVLVLVYISFIILGSSEQVVAFINSIPGLAELHIEPVINAFFSRKMNTVAGFFAVVNLFWTSRLFVLSIQRGLRVIFADAASGSVLRENAITFAVELLTMIVVVAVIVLLQSFQFVIKLLPSGYIGRTLAYLVTLARYLIPLAILWLFIAQTLKILPAYKIPRKKILSAATLCTLTYTVVAYGIQLLFSTNRYGIIYGVLGNVIALLIKVYFFFWLYFLFAEYTYTSEFCTAIAFSKYRAMFDKGKFNKVDRFVFASLKELFVRDTVALNPGSILFRKNEKADNAYFVISGLIEVHFEDPLRGTNPPAFTIEAGSFVGEMGALLQEARTAWAVAAVPTVLLKLDRHTLEHLFIHSPADAKNMIHLLSRRLRSLDMQLQEEEHEISGTL
jgi:membrane protein